MRHALTIAALGGALASAAHATVFYQTETIPTSSLSISYLDPLHVLIQGLFTVPDKTLLTGDWFVITANLSAPVTITAAPPFLEGMSINAPDGTIAGMSGSVNYVGDTFYGFTEYLGYFAGYPYPAGVDPYNFGGSYPITIMSVPEPAGWTMMLIGFGWVGARLRHRALRTAGCRC